MTIQSALTASEGYAVWYQAFSMRRMPPPMLSTRNDVAVPESRPVETRAYGTSTDAAPIQPRPSKTRSEDKGVRVGMKVAEINQGPVGALRHWPSMSWTFWVGRDMPPAAQGQ